MTELGERIKKIRGKMTQKEFSEILGITQRAVINYEISGRVPRKKILNSICEQFGICEQWLLTGEGPVYQHDEPAKISDCQIFSDSHNLQPIETKSKKNINIRQSDVFALQQELHEALRKGLELQERIASLVEEKAELQVSLERAMVTIERRDMRIHELEKENAGLREAQKGSAALQHDAGWKAG